MEQQEEGLLLRSGWEGLPDDAEDDTTAKAAAAPAATKATATATAAPAHDVDDPVSHRLQCGLQRPGSTSVGARMVCGQEDILLQGRRQGLRIRAAAAVGQPAVRRATGAGGSRVRLRRRLARVSEVPAGVLVPQEDQLVLQDQGQGLHQHQVSREFFFPAHLLERGGGGEISGRR